MKNNSPHHPQFISLFVSLHSGAWPRLNYQPGQTGNLLLHLYLILRPFLTEWPCVNILVDIMLTWCVYSVLNIQHTYSTLETERGAENCQYQAIIKEAVSGGAGKFRVVTSTFLTRVNADIDYPTQKKRSSHILMKSVSFEEYISCKMSG